MPAIISKSKWYSNDMKRDWCWWQWIFFSLFLFLFIFYFLLLLLSSLLSTFSFYLSIYLSLSTYHPSLDIFHFTVVLFVCLFYSSILQKKKDFFLFFFLLDIYIFFKLFKIDFVCVMVCVCVSKKMAVIFGTFFFPTIIYNKKNFTNIFIDWLTLNLDIFNIYVCVCCVVFFFVKQRQTIQTKQSMMMI